MSIFCPFVRLTNERSRVLGKEGWLGFGPRFVQHNIQLVCYVGGWKIR